MNRKNLEDLGLTESQIEAVLGDFEASVLEFQSEIDKKQAEIEVKAAEIDNVRLIGELRNTLKTQYKVKDPDDIIALLGIDSAEKIGSLDTEMKELKKKKAYLFDVDTPSFAGTPIRGEPGRFSENEAMNSIIRGNI